MFRVVCLAGVLFWLVIGDGARAEEACNLRRAAVLDGKLEGSNHLFLPAEFGGQTTRLLLDTGGGWSIIKERFVKNLALKPKKLRTIEYVDVAGGRITHYVTVPTFKLGPVALPESDFLVIPDQGDQDHESWGGTIGAERLSDFNVEIDNTTKSVTLYQPNKFCSGRIAPWTNNVVEIPFTFNDGIPELRVVVQGEKTRATFDTGSTDTLMDLDFARSAFGLTPASPGVEALNEETMISGKKLQFYSYRFKTLTVSDLTFTDVDVTLGKFDSISLILGMNEISQTNLYIAFQRKIIYATRIDAQK